jgi:hypothetical protein
VCGVIKDECWHGELRISTTKMKLEIHVLLTSIITLAGYLQSNSDETQDTYILIIPLYLIQERFRRAFPPSKQFNMITPETLVPYSPSLKRKLSLV